MEITLRNDAGNLMQHSLDFHAALGPSGERNTPRVLLERHALSPSERPLLGCSCITGATAVVAQHIANGMYGLICRSRPGDFLPRLASVLPRDASRGLHHRSDGRGRNAEDERSPHCTMEPPNYVVFNGAVEH